MVPGAGPVQQEVSLVEVGSVQPQTKQATSSRGVSPSPGTGRNSGLASRHSLRRSDRQLQDLAQCGQVRIPWPAVISLPEVDARLADADLLGNFGNRQSTPDASIMKNVGKAWLTRQRYCLLQGERILGPYTA
jgi:hypothetical protein